MKTHLVFEAAAKQPIVEAICGKRGTSLLEPDIYEDSRNLRWAGTLVHDEIDCRICLALLKRAGEGTP